MGFKKPIPYGQDSESVSLENNSTLKNEGIKDELSEFFQIPYWFYFFLPLKVWYKIRTRIVNRIIMNRH